MLAVKKINKKKRNIYLAVVALTMSSSAALLYLSFYRQAASYNESLDNYNIVSAPDSLSLSAVGEGSVAGDSSVDVSAPADINFGKESLSGLEIFSDKKFKDLRDYGAVDNLEFEVGNKNPFLIKK